MSEERPVVSAEIPEFTGNLEQLEKDAADIASDGKSIGSAGSLIDTRFQLLEPFYKAPEADQLFATTSPVASAGDDLRTELGTASQALLDYAAEVRPLVDRFNSLRAGAAAFERRVADDDEWRADGDLVEENNNRRSDINAAYAAFQAAERDCYNRRFSCTRRTGPPTRTGPRTRRAGSPSGPSPWPAWPMTAGCRSRSSRSTCPRICCGVTGWGSSRPEALSVRAARFGAWVLR